MEIQIRTATEADVPLIRDIYNYEILNGTATFDTEPKTLEDRMARFHDTRQHPYGVLAAEVDEETVGWGGLQPYRSRPAYRFTSENSIYIHQDWRGRTIVKAI